MAVLDLVHDVAPHPLAVLAQSLTCTTYTPDGRVLFHLGPALRAVATSTDDHKRVQRLATAVGVHTRTILKWQENGGVSLWVADRIATRLGVNAVRLWPTWEAEADAASAACEERPQQLDFYDLAAS